MKSKLNKDRIKGETKIKRGSMVYLKTSIWLDNGLVTCFEDRRGEMCVPERASGIVTFVYSDNSYQVSFLGLGCFMIEEDWLRIA